MKTTKHGDDLPRRDEHASSIGAATASAVREGCAHTPGPWSLDGRTIYVAQFVDGGTRNIFHATVEVSPRHLTAQQGEANARLMAAAPELLAALKSCIDICDRSCIGDLTLMRAALAKAEKG